MSVRKIPKNRITKDGRSYAFIVTEYGLDGKRHQHQSKAYMTYEEALRAEQAYLNKYKDIDVNPHITFYQAYLKVYDYKKDKIRATTLKTYRDRIHFMKLFWDVELVDLDADIYQRWRNQMNKTDLSDRYKTDIQKLIKTICNYAEKQWDFNLRKFYNKLEPFKTPGAIKKEMDVYKPEEFYKFISVVDDIQMRCLYKALYYCGLRRGEARGLQWKNVDLDNRRIYIKHQVQNNVETNNDKDWYICACKTNTSHRTVPIPEDLFEELTEFKRQLKKYKAYRDTWFVFGDKNPIGTHKMNNWKNAYCKKAGIKQIRLHDFRHSCVSALINAKSPVPTISALVGHSTPTETLDTYSHMFEESLEGVTDYFDKIFEENKQKNHQNNGD